MEGQVDGAFTSYDEQVGLMQEHVGGIRELEHKNSRYRPRAQGSQDMLAQITYAPATQTTVVTTTTTTTTSFPPLMLPPPGRRQALDPKQYPLASSPTPASLRKLAFKFGGSTAFLREADDTQVALEKLQDEQSVLQRSKGKVRNIEAREPWVQTDPQLASNSISFMPRERNERPASPDSIAESADPDDGVMRPLKRRRLSSRESLADSRGSIQPHPRIRGLRSETPITPESEFRDRVSRRLTRNTRQSKSKPAVLPTPQVEQSSTFATQQSTDENLNSPEELEYEDVHNALTSPYARGMSHDTTVPTPPVEADDIPGPSRPITRRALSSIPARLHVAASLSGQDGSLPSPSLSPVTAAAHLQQGGYFADVESSSEVASQPELGLSTQDLRQDTPTRMISGPSSATVSAAPGLEEIRFSVTDIPNMLDFFEAIPDELKGYVMHQLLRRCPKPTLQVVADVVNPALKCDFLTTLPAELGLTIVRYLDLRTLCRAAQVSMKWRQMINSDEKVWRELFDAEGFSLPEGELQQAITEGWGWQDPFGTEGFEMNIGRCNTARSENEGASSFAGSPNPARPSTGGLRRSKRKAATMFSSRKKHAKRKHISRDTSVDAMSANLMDQMSTSEGPYNAASAALVAVPHPEIALPSLKGMHLYKTLYRRHHLIRRNWMFEDTRPRHLAFRAHDTHVVTCLQFDTEKILTGSDDNNINVYDTKTGALRAKLVGHEGGVWALQYEGNTLVSGSTDRSVRVWDIEKGEERQVFRGHTSTVRCLQIVMPVKVGENAEGRAIMTPKYPLIITGSRDSTLRVWRLPRSEDPPFIQAENEIDVDDCPYFVRALIGHQHSVRAIAAHADTLVSGSYDCTVRVWKISTGETTHRLQGHTAKVYSVVLDHARNRCISGSMDNMVRIWSLATGSLEVTLEGHTSLVGLLDLHSDRLVSAAADSTLRIWDPETGQCKNMLSAHTGAITCFQHDGQKVISGSDRTLKLWNIKTGECVKDLLSDLSGVWQVQFNDRRCVAAVQREGVTYIEVSPAVLSSRHKANLK